MKEGKSFEMAIKIHVRRLTSLFLCCLLVFCSIPVEAYATDPVTAASLAVTGGQLAGAGLSGEAALSLAGPVGAVVGVTLGALGVNAYVSQAAQEAGKTRTRYVLDKLVIWGAQAGYTQEQLYSKIAEGISVAADGTIQLTDDVAKYISQFGSWLFTQENTVFPSVPAASVSATVGGYSVTPVFNQQQYIFNDAGSYWWFNGLPANSYAFFASNGTYLCVLSTGASTIGVSALRSDGANISSGNMIRLSMSDGRYFYYWQNWTGATSPFPVTSSNLDGCIGGMTGQSITTTETPATDECFTGTPEAWNTDKDVLNPAITDTPITLNPDLLNPIIDSLADGQQATMSIIDYLQALQDAWDHALDDVQTAIGTITDTLTGIQETIAVPDEAVKNPTVTNPSVTPDTTPILNPSDVDPGTAITGLSFDLTNIFPFCIPFDIYAALNLLDAEPVAPSYHFHLEWPYNIVIDFTLDLSPFNQVAAVARTMEILLFIIGLAVMTRSMFIRG